MYDALRYGFPVIAIIVASTALIVYPGVIRDGLGGGLRGILVLLLMVSLFALAAVLLFKPSWFIRFTGIFSDKWSYFNTEPQIVGVPQDPLRYGIDNELELWGTFLLQNDVVPTVKVDNIELKTKSNPAPNDTRIVVDVSETEFEFKKPSGKYELALHYIEEKGPTLEIDIKVATKPLPELIISNFSITPRQPLKGQNVKTNITVVNRGPGVVESDIGIHWRPLGENAPDLRVGTITGGIAAGSEASLDFDDYAYAVVGKFESIAVIDPKNKIDRKPNPQAKATISDIEVLDLPPNLRILDFKIVPDENEFGDSKIYVDRRVECTIVVENSHQSDDVGPVNEDIVIEWDTGGDAGHKESYTHTGGLSSGQRMKATFGYAYKTPSQPHSFQSVAMVHRVQREIDQGDNFDTKSVWVEPLPPPPKPKLEWMMSSGLKYDDGRRPCVLMTNDGRIFEVHDGGGKDVYYLFGKLNRKKDNVHWIVSDGEHFEDGYSPTLAWAPIKLLGHSDPFVVVYDDGGNSLYYLTGFLLQDNIDWRWKEKGIKLGSGKRPAAAWIPDDSGMMFGNTVLVYWDGGYLYYRIGRFIIDPSSGGTGVNWGDEAKYDRGDSAAVAAAPLNSGKNRIVEIHKGSDSHLYYRVGIFNPTNSDMDWSGVVEKYWSEIGDRPSIAITKDNMVLVTHDGGKAKDLYCRLGKLEANDTITWYDDPVRYNKGKSPSIAVNQEEIIVQVNDDGGGDGDLFYMLGKKLGSVTIFV